MTAAERVGANVRRAREAAGLSQEQLSFASEIHRTQVSLIERGVRLPRILTLLKIAGGLGVAPGDLLEGVAWKPGVISYGQLTVGDA